VTQSPSLFSSTTDDAPAAPAPAGVGNDRQPPPASAAVAPAAPPHAAGRTMVHATERGLEGDGSWRQTAEPLVGTSEQLSLRKPKSESHSNG
jgi:hypothetical protein